MTPPEWPGTGGYSAAAAKTHRPVDVPRADSPQRPARPATGANAGGRGTLSRGQRIFLLDVDDWLHLWGTDPVSFDQWWQRICPTTSRDSAQRRWERLKQKLVDRDIPHERVLVPDLVDHVYSHSVHVRVLGAAYRMVDELLSLPVSDRAYCPCDSGRPYARCCKKREAG